MDNIKKHIKTPIIRLLLALILIAFVLAMGGIMATPVSAGGAPTPTVAAVNGGNDVVNQANHTVNLPTGIEELDLLIIFFVTDEIPAVTFPAGWTQLFDDVSAAIVRSVGYYRIADGTEGATITVTTGDNQMTAHTSYRITGYSGVPEAGVAVFGNSVNPNPPSLAPSWGVANTLWLASCGYNLGTEIVTLYPANYTNGRNDRSDHAEGVGAGIARRGAASTSEDPGTFTISAVEDWVANTIAIRPSVIGNPAIITFGSLTDTNMYRVFQDLTEEGDWLFVGESWIYYSSLQGTPTDYTAQQAFSFQVLDTDGTTVLYSTPILEYGNYPTSIYLTAAQATAAGLAWEGSYSVRLTGNATIFGAPSEGVYTRTHTLQADDYLTDDPTGTSALMLRVFALRIMTDLEVVDSPTDPGYVITVQGTNYLTTVGGTIFLRAVPGSSVWWTAMLQTTSTAIEEEALAPTETYAASLTMRNQLGDTIADGITNFGAWMGMSTTMAGIVIVVLLILVLSGYAYVKLESWQVPDAIAIALPIIASYLGLIPLAVMFAIVATVVVLTGYFIFTRGSL